MRRWILILLLFAPIISWGQDVHFSQLNSSPLLINPAMAGANNDFETNLLFRSQWGTVGKAYQTVGASVASRLNVGKAIDQRKVHLAAGLDFYSDWAGLSKVSDNRVNLHFATHVRLAETSHLGLGVYGGWGQRSFDDRNSTWASQYDGESFNPLLSSGENFGRATFGAFDVGVGMVYTYSTAATRMAQNDRKSFNIGFSTYHLNRADYSFLGVEQERQYMRFSGFFSGHFGIALTRFSIEPALHLNFQGPAREIVAGSNFRYHIREESSITIFVNQFSVYAGLFYRHLDALIVQAGFDWNGLHFGFAYDVNAFNSLISASKGHGAFEFALGWSMPDFSRRRYIKRGGRSMF